ncbi:DNA repair protein complementing XP-A cells-like [Anneissia japonica]|uniref:DNA repair protein complementing XP-A cells-like n=1 Tax=Anneissia japonica TaxID=1529436 RepID=UPI0014258AA1|nr:DNA repair protein complementing XP-A cells-like [Anneissia japonica]
MESNADEVEPQNGGSHMLADGPKQLSDKQRAKVERNRQRALMLRNARLKARPYSKQKAEKTISAAGLSGGGGGLIQGKRFIDTGAGFLLEEDLDEETEKKAIKIVEEPAPDLSSDDPYTCIECQQGFQNSYLVKNFDHQVCDECRDNDDKHQLITKTDAKNLYLIKDVDLDKREPILKFILRKNPHNSKWGDMKLYLKLQVEKKALSIWNSLEEIEEEKEKRTENKEKAKQKKFNKKIKDLRKEVRTSLWTRDLSEHCHSYGEEFCVDEENDMYSKECSCGHKLTYEKM